MMYKKAVIVFAFFSSVFCNDSIHITFIGNSIQYYGIDFEKVSSTLQCIVKDKKSWGAHSAWQYAALWNETQQAHPPDYIVVTTRCNLLSQPTARTTGKYWDDILLEVNKDSVLLGEINQTLTEANNISNNYNFDNSVSYTFLPKMIARCKNFDVQLIIVRSRQITDVTQPLFSDSVITAYRQSLSRYLALNKVLLLEFPLNPELMVEHFGEGDHLNELGKEIWTSQIIADLSAILKNDIGNSRHEITQYIGCSAPQILFPQNNIVIPSSAFVALQGSNTKFYSWSCLDSSNGCGERLIGFDNPCAFATPLGSNLCKPIMLFLYGNGFRYSTQFILDSSISGSNHPPFVDAGPDVSMRPGDTVKINAIATDDSLPIGKTLTFSWKVVQGSPVIIDTSSCTISFVFPQTGVAIIRFTAFDGAFYCHDDVTVSAFSDDCGYLITSPDSNTIWEKGETVFIQWKTFNTDNAGISISYNGGKTWSDIAEILYDTDSSWENYQWTVPLNTVSTTQARIRISKYSDIPYAKSPLFTIIGGNTNSKSEGEWSKKKETPIIVLHRRGNILEIIQKNNTALKKRDYCVEIFTINGKRIYLLNSKWPPEINTPQKIYLHSAGCFIIRIQYNNRSIIDKVVIR